MEMQSQKLKLYDVSVEYQGHTKGDQFGIFCSYEKIYKALGWEPKVSLETGIKKMAEWALHEGMR